MREDAYLQKFEDVSDKTQIFIAKMSQCLESGRGLVNQGAALVAAFKDIQIARQQQELEFQRMMANWDERSRRFDEISPYIQNSLDQRMKRIDEIRSKLNEHLMVGVNSEAEKYACETCLKMLQMEHQGYFAELDRLINM
ncbi:MAG: hypothetical protein J1F05_06755 [Muribaculaceae bacterium]|nr:hypothetical protein [Muribaculaceae bacterium]